MATNLSRDNEGELRPKVTEEAMRDAIWRSGYLLERRVAALLKKKDYRVVANRGFRDQETAKSREYDVYAYKEFDVFGKGSYGIYPTLVCECKNNPQPVAFLVQQEEFEPLIDEVRVSGIPAKIWHRDRYISFQEFAEVNDYHHYCTPKAPVATQFCTFDLKKGTSSWMASHGEDLYEVFRTVTKALEEEIDNDFKNMNQWFEPGETEREFIDLSFYYPTVIFRGDLYAAHAAGGAIASKDDVRLERCDHVQYNPEFYSCYDGEVISYHMDIITESYLPKYVSMLEEEMVRTREVLRDQKTSVIRSIDKIIAESIGEKDPTANLRKHLEFKF